MRNLHALLFVVPFSSEVDSTLRTSPFVDRAPRPDGVMLSTVGVRRPSFAWRRLVYLLNGGVRKPRRCYFEPGQLGRVTGGEGLERRFMVLGRWLNQPDRCLRATAPAQAVRIPQIVSVHRPCGRHCEDFLLASKSLP